MRRPMCESKGGTYQVGSELANWFLNIWAHQTLLDGCDCLFAMEMLKANEAEGEGRISRGQWAKFYDEVLRQWIVAKFYDNGLWRILTAFVFPNTMFLPDGCKLGSKSLNPILQNLRGRIGWYL